MATKYFCDGCDKEVPLDMVERISVSIQRNGSVTAAGGAYELCKGCADHMVRDSNPRNWVRCAEPMKRVV